jgi:hypothetical protein
MFVGGKVEIRTLFLICVERVYIGQGELHVEKKIKKKHLPFTASLIFVGVFDASIVFTNVLIGGKNSSCNMG